MPRLMEPVHCTLFSPLPRALSSFAPSSACAAHLSALWRGSLRQCDPFLSSVDLDAATFGNCREYSICFQSFDVERAQAPTSFCPLSSPQPRHVCSCLGKDDMVIDIKGTKSSWIKEEDLLNSFKQMLSMDENSFFYGTDDDDEDVGALKDSSLLRAIVKVFCVSAEPDYSLPWQLQRQVTSTGSGFMISGKRLLTNAHCVQHHTQVTVKRTGDDTKYIATVLAIGAECDLALLTVQDDEFWKDAKPVEFGGLPNLQDSVTVIGYPLGGATVSVTKGVVSRVEVCSYAHGDSELLAVQIDAAINPGNSGGPAFNDDGECVGIAFQGYTSAENIGYVIPTPIIHHFLKDYNVHGKYTGFPSLGLVFQKLSNPDLRASLQMTPEQKGILVRKVEPTSPANDIFKEGDVILSFDGIPISNESTVPLRPGERTALSFLVSQKFTSDKAVLRVLRDGKEIELTTVLQPMCQMVPVHLKNRQPTYFIIAGLVFTAVTEPLLQEDYGEENIYVAVRIRAASGFNMAEFEGQEIVLLSQVLAHAVNIGYEDVSHLKALHFNGMKIRNVKHLAQLVDSCTSPYMRFELEDRVVVVLATNSARAATPGILKEYCIAHDRSQNLRDATEDTAMNGALT